MSFYFLAGMMLQLAAFQGSGQWLQVWVPNVEEPKARSPIICNQARGLVVATVKQQRHLPPKRALLQHGFGTFPGSYALNLFLHPSQ